MPAQVAAEITQLLLKKPKHRSALLLSMAKAFATLESAQKIKRLELMDSWSVATDEQIKVVIESSSLSAYERDQLKNIIARVGAFQAAKASAADAWEDEEPF